VIGVPAAGEHGVQLLPGFLPGQQAVHRVGGDALGGMDGGGVAESGRGLNVVGGKSDGELAAGVPDREVTALADAGDGPAVAVLNPVGGGESESAVVAAGNDHIADTGPVSIGQSHLPSDRGVIKTMRPGAAVEFGDELAGGASMIVSIPADRSRTQAVNASSVVVAMSPTWTRSWSS
jgi:hypothetical protein